MKIAKARLEVSAEQKKTMLVRTFVVGGISLVLVAGIVLRLYQLQILNHERYATRATDNRLVTQPLAPARGLVFDRNGNVLAGNKQVQSVSAVGENIEDINALLERVREILPFSADEEESFRKRLKNTSRPGEKVILKRHLNDVELATFAVNRYRYPELSVTTETLRDYPMNDLMAHVVGSVRQITKEDLQRLDPIRYGATMFIGRRGVEKFYEDALHGQVGKRTVEVNVHGRVMRELTREPPARGRTITLHIDAMLQRIADEALGDRRGAVVAIDPSTGGILTLVSKPTYDPNSFVMGMTDRAYNHLINRRDTPLFNRATQGTYPPGSTFKPIVALACLSEELVDWEEEINDITGEFRLPNSSQVWRDWYQHQSGRGQGKMDMYRAIYRSSNIFFYELSTRLEVDGLARFANSFGIGRATAIDVADAVDGLMPTKQWKRETKGESWYRGDNVNLFIGQGDILVTPLQMATFAGLLANRGEWIRPRLLMSSDQPIELGEAFTRSYPRIEGPSEDDWTMLVDSLRAVIHRGNEGYLQNGIAWAYIGMDIPYEMAGKSGTVQVVGIPYGEELVEEPREEYKQEHALFFGFAPVDEPVIAVAVVIENGAADGGGGSSVAGPVVRSVIDAYLGKSVAVISD
ncbi:MAG: penicillin-binding protein 2 [Gammaproteobacteria bacterium]|nr:penicillin-binding protein 2 [Gammaproteobacteria bacterium]